MNGLISLITIGEGISNKKEEEIYKDNWKKNKKKDNYITNIYSNNDVIKNEKKYWDLRENKFNESLKKKSLIINDIYNKTKNKVFDNYNMKEKNNDSDSEFSDEEYDKELNKQRYSKKVQNIKNVEYFNNVKNKNKNNIKRRNNQNRNLNKLLNEKKKLNKKQNDSLLDYQFESAVFNNPSNPVAYGKISNDIDNSYEGLTALEELKEGYSDINKNGSYNVLPDELLTHNNMVPQFKSKGLNGYETKDNFNHLSNQFNRKNNLFTGSLNDVSYKQKTERRPLFNPMIGLTNVYGSPVKTDEYEGRYIPSRERRNELPFQPIKDTPGLNLGYNTIGATGFHDKYRALPKTTNELRTADNPKVSYANPMSQGNLKNPINAFQRYGGGSRAVNPNVFKRRPEKFKEIPKKNLLPNSFPVPARKVDGYINPLTMATNNRGVKNDNLHGPLGTSSYDKNKTQSYNEKNLTPDATNRNTYNYNQVSNLKGNTIKQQAYNQQSLTPDATNRNIYNYNQVSNLKGNIIKQQAYNQQSLTPNPTLRNIHNSNEVLNIKGYEKSQTYNKEGLTPNPTLRNIHNSNDILNIKGYEKGQSYNKQGLTPDATLRNIHNSNEILNVKGYEKGQTYNKEGLTPDPTLRNIHNSNEILNVKGYEKSQIYNKEGLTPDPTLRNIHNSNEILNVKGYEKGQIYNKEGLTPNPTLRNTYNYKDIKPAYNSTNTKTYIYNKKLLTPEPTNRNTYNYNDLKPAKGDNKPRDRTDARNSYVNVSKDELTINKHTPTLSNYEKTPTIENTIVSMKNKININRDLIPEIQQKLVLDNKDIPMMRGKQQLKKYDNIIIYDHQLQYPLDTLQNNPYVNDGRLKSEYPENYFNDDIRGLPEIE